MSRTMTVVLALVAGLAVGVPLGGQLMSGGGDMVTDVAPEGFAAVPGEVGAEDLFGPYDVVQDWPKGVQSLPGHEEWTSGAAQGIFAESPDRVYLLARGELPNLERPSITKLSDIGPSLQFPIGGLPWRSHTQTAIPGNGGWAPMPQADSRPGKTASAAAYLVSTPDGSTASSL